VLTGYFRFAALCVAIGFFAFVAILLRLVIGSVFQSPVRAKRAAAVWLHLMCRLGLRILGIRVELSDVNGSDLPVMKVGESHLIVSNHLSYLDILVIAANQPTLFVTSIEIRESGFLGFLSKAGACHFVERRNRNQIEREVEEIAGSLRDGLNVVVFPEATSTDGSSVLPFKVSLMDAAILSGRPLQPYCINYKEIAGQPVSVQNRDEVCWYGDMTFADHLLNVARRGGIKVTLQRLAKITVKPGSDRKSIAGEAYSQVSASYVPLV
jgi:1-acyl-sn-glycerol-3-phosphate acyltransferase